MRRLALLAVALLLPLPAIEDDPRAQAGFDHFFNLEYDQALAVFRGLAAKYPDNPDYHNHIAETILYRELYRVGALESELVTGSNPFLRRPKVEPSKEDEQEFITAVSTAMSLCEQRLKQKPADIAALYGLGVAYGLRSNYNFLIRKAWMDALKDATASRKTHQKILDIDRSEVDARMIPSIHEYVVGSLPWYYRMLGFLVGFRGDKEGGIRGLEEVAKKGNRNRENAEILLCVAYRRERRPGDAVPILKRLIEAFPRNYILRMELVQMYSDLGKKDEGLEVIREMEDLKRKGAPGYDRMPEHKIWYTRGTLLFWYMDLKQALEDFRRMTEVEDELNLHTAQLAWYRLGQTYDLLGQRQQALPAYRKAIELAPNSDRARQARFHLRTPCTVKNRK